MDPADLIAEVIDGMKDVASGIAWPHCEAAVEQVAAGRERNANSQSPTLA